MKHKLFSMSTARAAIAGAAVIGIVVAFVGTLDEVERVPLPSLPRLVFAVVLLFAGQLAALGGWGILIPAGTTRALAPGYFLAQLAKYVPGSVWQGVGQVMDAVRLGSGRGAATVAYMVQMVTQTVAGFVLAILVLLARPSGWLLAAAIVSPLSVVLLNRRWMQLALRLLSRVSPGRLGHLSDTVVDQASILRAAGLTLVAMLLISLSFPVLLLGEVGARAVLAAAGAFSLSWVIGLLVVPVPSGLGIRELVLVGALGGDHGTAAVLAAAVVLRLLVIVVEGLLALMSRMVPAPART